MHTSVVAVRRRDALREIQRFWQTTGHLLDVFVCHVLYYKVQRYPIYMRLPPGGFGWQIFMSRSRVQEAGTLALLTGNCLFK